MSIHSVLVTGSSRGIGFGLVQKFLESDKVGLVIAASRPSATSELLTIKNKKLHLVTLDVTDDDSIVKAVEQVDQIVGQKGLTILVNNAGILQGYGFTDKPNRDVVNQTFDTNITSPMMMAQYFYPLLKRAADSQPGNTFSSSRAAIVNISSILGSIQLAQPSDNGIKKLLDYSVSKAGVNMVSRILSKDLEKDGIMCTAVHPGWIQTRMGGEHAPITPED
ncbi:hypothetical protein WR25_01912 [Diploscapter pachys]|uniref:Uncharacterized protein n=1 Tax=Diploscapter pachys TaxID=2018661 RepID=A0A2A2JSJ8_9BILA|nr:hypothetical protein WR25_01912 [Diploscapter pachys]